MFLVFAGEIIAEALTEKLRCDGWLSAYFNGELKKLKRSRSTKGQSTGSLASPISRNSQLLKVSSHQIFHSKPASVWMWKNPRYGADIKGDEVPDIIGFGNSGLYVAVGAQ